MEWGHLVEWVGLLVRWFHLTLGIAWIGASFYFVWLNNAVRPPAPGEAPEGVAGDLWSVHGGAFYRVQKYGGAPPKLPGHLHWFKNEAYFTWISGFVLLILHFWATASTTMVDPSVAVLSGWTAVGIGAATLVGGWVFYDLACKVLAAQPVALAALLCTFVAVVDFGLFQLLAPRAAFLHVGAMLGTWMAANVWFVIIPGQEAMVDAMVKGEPPPLERGKAGALRSLHNNYLTLPVLFVMISGHFPSTYGNVQGWALLLGVAVAGLAVRHAINVAERGTPMNWLYPVGLGCFALTAFAARPPAPPPAEPGAAPVSFTDVQIVVANRCLPCHSDHPTLMNLTAPPKGLVLDSPEHIAAVKDKIRAQAVDSQIMPLGNLTQMTDDERALLGRWTRQP